jgi:hypothetical protein
MTCRVCSCVFLHRLQGTAPDIFERIEANESFVEQLDTRIMPGTKHVPRWVAAGRMFGAGSTLRRAAVAYNVPCWFQGSVR